MSPTLYFKVNEISFTVEPENYTRFMRNMFSAAGIGPSGYFSYEISICQEGQVPVTFLPEPHFVIAVSVIQPQQPYLSLNNKRFYPLEANSVENPYLLSLSLFSKSSFLS